MSSREALAALLWAVVVTLLLSAPALPMGTAQALPPQPSASGGSGGGEDCQRACGDVPIPYPFGFGPAHCALDNGFLLNCNDAGNGDYKPFMGNVEVRSVSLQGEAKVMNHISTYCKNTQLNKMVPSAWRLELASPFVLSASGNMFTVIGCQTLAYIGRKDDVKQYMTGCVSFWPPGSDYPTNGSSCSGMGCCQTAIPSGLNYYEVWFQEGFDPSQMNSSCNCSYAVLMDSSNFTFSPTYLVSSDFNDSNTGEAPLLLQWGIGNDKCAEARTKEGYACVSDHSDCFDAASGQGYICNCSKGFSGNPYLLGGCTDINECENPKEHGCYGKCINEPPGEFRCFCHPGSRGNASVEGSCQKQLLSSLGERLGVGIVAAVLVGLFGFLGIQVIVHKRNSRRQAYFQEHGGQVLLRMLKRDGNTGFTFYDKGDIVKATGNFRKAKIVGEGAHGTVYKAVLDVSGAATAVAVKRCKEIDKTKTMEFVQELVVLCSVRHPNVVKLLGCCLQFEAPVLVYEFVQNGTLRHLLHGGRPRCPLTLATRLKIAADSAVALEHLHSRTILHGDVKPENILLGDGLIAKVSDFGCSTIDDNVQVIPKGTLGYLDPEFLNNSMLTEKSDVYSFGVVLMELLTGKKPLVKDRKNLTLLFQQSLAAGTLGELLDAGIEVDGNSMVVIREAAELACRCIAAPSETRPTMALVAMELRGLSDQASSRSQPQQEIVLQGLGHTEMSDDEMMTSGYTTTTENLNTGFHLLQSRAAFSTELAR